MLSQYVDETTLGPEVQNNQCTAANKPGTEKRSFKCAERDCEVLVAKSRPLSQCFSLLGLDCGDMSRLVQSYCFSQTASEVVPLSEPLSGTPCENVTHAATLETCTGGTACDTYFYQLSAWSKCSATCASCSPPDPCEISGTRTRTAACVQMTGNTVSTVSDSNCDGSAVVSEACSKMCFHPLLRFTRSLGDCTYGDCDVPGSRQVSYTACSSGNGCQRWANITVPGAAGTTECPAKPCNPCADVSCFEAGTSSQEVVGDTCQCTCNAGFTGSRCHIEEGREYKVLSADGTECASGAIDILGTCCQTPDFDGCGYCTGSTVPSMMSTRVGYDINGVCCHGGADVFLTTSFTCCQTIEDVDECGVCGGSGDTCKKTLSGTLSVSAGSTYGSGDFVTALIGLFPSDIQSSISETASSRRRLMQTDTSVALELASGIATTLAELTAAFVRTGISASNSGDLATAPDPPDAAVQGTPGNGVCETGEVPGSDDCPIPQDCPMPTAMDDGNVIGNAVSPCAGKGGVCIRASGTCMCPPGYIGDACDRCDGTDGYVAVPTSDGYACTRLAQDFAPDPAPTMPAPPPPMTSTPPMVDGDQDSGMGTGVIVGIAVGAVGGVAILVGVVYYVLRVRGAKEVSPV